MKLKQKVWPNSWNPEPQHPQTKSFVDGGTNAATRGAIVFIAAPVP